MLRALVLTVAIALAVPAAADALQWHRSRSLGLPFAGRLVSGVQLPVRGRFFETWDHALKRIPNRGWRRWGSDRLVRTVLHVLRAYGRAHPSAPPVLVGDLSRRHGGDFSRRFGGLGHSSHQNGLDVDVYYPRRDRVLRPPAKPSQIDYRLAQDLLDRFLRAGAVKIFVGPNTHFRAPPRIVWKLVHHDNHMHVRIRREERQVIAGQSARGRPIRALELGFPGRRRVLVVGCIHGNERAGIAVVRRLQALAPPRFDLWVVPSLNPDGAAAGTRQNGRGVDLNRNFPSQWRPNGSRWSTYFSGERPLSEPESRFATRLVARIRPDVTIWFHQQENLVRAWGPSIRAARRYARLTGMTFRRMRWPRGTAPNWQNHRFRGTASFVVELPAGQLTRTQVARHVRASLKLGGSR